MFRVTQAAGRHVARLRACDALRGGPRAATLANLPRDVSWTRGIAGNAGGETHNNVSIQSVAVGAAAVAAAAAMASSFEPRTRMEAPKATRGGSSTGEPGSKPASAPEPKDAKPLVGGGDKEKHSPSEKNNKPPVAKSDAELFYAQLLSQRRVFLNGRVDDKSAHGLIGKLLFLDQVDPETPIVLYINSGGGVVTSGLAIYDVMEHVRPPVYTVCVGHAESMAAVLLSAGAKGHRYALPNARVMIHQPHHVISGQTTEILIKSKKAERTRRALADILQKHTDKSAAEITEALERDTYMSAKEAVAFGIVDKEIVGVGEIA
jgi:ATP-dependent Clp protease protease subunit